MHFLRQIALKVFPRLPFVVLSALFLTFLSLVLLRTSVPETHVPVRTYSTRIEEKCVGVTVTKTQRSVHVYDGTVVAIPQGLADVGELVKTSVVVDACTFDLYSWRDENKGIHISTGVSLHCYMSGYGTFFCNEDNQLVCSNCCNTFTLDVMDNSNKYEDLFCYPYAIENSQFEIVPLTAVQSICPQYDWITLDDRDEESFAIVIGYDVLHEFVCKLNEMRSSEIDFDWRWRW